MCNKGGIIMAQATFSVRMDESLKVEFETLCNYFGMNMTTAINIFARAVVKEKKIPFEIAAPEIYSQENAMKVFNSIRAKAKENGINDLSMDEIDLEIANARKETGK